MKRLIFILLGILGLSALLFFTISLFDTNSQLESKTESLLEAVENANRGALDRLLADDYTDQWEQDHATAVENTVQISKQFLVLDLGIRRISPTFIDRSATVEVEIDAAGKGSAVGSAILRKANSLETPWILHWRRTSWLPWSWKLTHVENQDLKQVRRL